MLWKLLYYDVLDDCNDDVILTTVISYIKNKAMLLHNFYFTSS